MIRQPLLLTSGISDLLGIPEQQFFRRSEESTAAGILADKALAMIGAPETFSRNGHGLPVWPAGFNGSISHCQGEAAVAVRQGQPLGIDMEKISRVTDKIFDRIAVPAEKAAGHAVQCAGRFSDRNAPQPTWPGGVDQLRLFAGPSFLRAVGKRYSYHYAPH